MPADGPDQPEHPTAAPDAAEDAKHDRDESSSTGGAESYGGDPDTEPSVTEEDVETGLERDQAEG